MAARFLAAVTLALLVVTGVERSLPSGDLRDFGSFTASARAGAQGQSPYGVYPLTFHVVVPGFDLWNPNLNPPISVIAFRVFERLEPARAFRLWWSLSLICYVAAVSLLVRRYPGSPEAARYAGLLLPLWAFAHAGLWDTLFLGQLYLPLVLAVAGSWLLLDADRPLSAGVLMGILVAVKPNFMVWPALLFLAGHRRAPLSAAATAVALTAVPLVTHGTEIYRQWVSLIMSDEARGAFLTNASLPGLAQRIGNRGLGTLLAIGLLAGAMVWAWRRKPAPLEASAFGLAVGILVSPIAWVHYTLFLLPVFFSRRPSKLLALAAALLVLPVPFVLRFLDAPVWQQVTIGSAYNWAMLLCLSAFMKERARPAQLTLSSRDPARHDHASAGIS
ncbi:glycosyltransferase 87 family protein [soil metagenome]